MDDYAPSMGAALAYYTLFSLAPLLIIVIAIAGLVFGAEAARGEIVAQLRGLIGSDGALAVQGLLKSASRPSTSVLASIASVLTLIVGATSVLSELQSDLDRIWRAPAVTAKTGILALIRSRLLTFSVVLAIGFLLLVSLAVSAGLSALGSWWKPYFGGMTIVLRIADLVISFGVITVLFAFIYKMLPRVHVAWRDVFTGAAVTSLLFTLGKFLIGLYLGRSGVTSGFGAAGSIVILLVWVYYSAQIFLLGAEFTWVFAHREGSRAAAPAPGPAPPIPSQSGEAEPGRPMTPAKPPRPGVQPAAAAAAPSGFSRGLARVWVSALTLRGVWRSMTGRAVPRA